MKSILITLFVSVAGILSGFAQCEENAILTTSETNLTDVSGNPVGIKDEKTVLRFSKAAILLNIDGEDRGELKIVSQTCNWTIPYKEGKTIIQATMNDSDYTIIIEGKDSKVNLTAMKNSSDDNILSMIVDKFEKTD